MSSVDPRNPKLHALDEEWEGVPHPVAEPVHHLLVVEDEFEAYRRNAELAEKVVNDPDLQYGKGE